MTGQGEDTMTDVARDARERPTAPGRFPIPGSRLLVLGARLLLGAVFIYASFDKILHPEAFARAIYNYQILPGSLVNLAALALPWVELVIGLLLVANRWMPGATLTGTLLFVVFIAALAYNQVRGLDVHCGCFTTDSTAESANWLTVARDLFFLVVSACLLLATFFRKEPRIETNRHE
jgi:uncharacterized membrane protein YphA (DoxX/SURF4 family)